MISLSQSAPKLDAKIPLPSSKSESNRALIIQALSQEEIVLENLAEARDTQTMIRLLNDSEGHVLDVLDAGTTMRFLTAYFSATGRDQILTGTPRMCQRPIGVLVDALRELGAEIDYWKQEGFPPLHIISKGSKMQGGKISMPGNISSQFISAILMIAPTLEGGVQLELEGKITSKPYIDMTRALMARFGIDSKWDGNSIHVSEGQYKGGTYGIEGDWSAASYWYSMVAQSKGGKLEIHGLRKNSIQGDSSIVELSKHFGVETTYTDQGLSLVKTNQELPSSLEIDFSTFPDLAQTIAVMGAALGVELSMTGLHTLRIKETDRIAALENELEKMGVETESSEDSLKVKGRIQKSALINTYDDHRMAMAFAPLVMSLPSISIKEPSVVDKSYPSFWKHMELTGVKILG
ncbi:MAG: 3-phosphoshikimate 1-carboxyvinyltransferase [Bacteroidia bacterium]|nr:3-phosphoshikimate 1-carboxyvinyltransferase [Bacteroidia bacterium]